jgi:hypothetical protein
MQEAVEELRKQGVSPSSKAPARLPTPSEADAMVDRDTLAGIKEGAERMNRGKSPSLGGSATLMSRGHEELDNYPTAMALVMARVLKRIAVKNADLGLMRDAKSLDREANVALKARQPLLRRALPTDADDAPGSSRQQKPTLLGTEGTVDPLAERYAEEHRRFLDENNPSVLRGQSDLHSYLSSVGEAAAERLEHQMAKFANSPEVQKLPHLERVRALQNHRQSVEEQIMHDLILPARAGLREAEQKPMD